MSKAPARAVLISVHPRFASAFADGTKKVELRRRFPDVEPGTHLVVYATVPVGAIVGIGTIGSLDRGEPTALWERHHASVALERPEFDAYFRRCSKGCAISLDTYVTLARPLLLAELRSRFPGFRPPQSYHYADLRTLGLNVTGHRRPMTAPLDDARSPVDETT